MKNIFSLIMLSVLLAGCGDDSTSALSANEVGQADAYALKNRYNLEYEDGGCLSIFGFTDVPLGKINYDGAGFKSASSCEQNSFVNLLSCHLRFTLDETGIRNFYHLKVEVLQGDYSEPGCEEQLNNNYWLTVTSETTATIKKADI